MKEGVEDNSIMRLSLVHIATKMVLLGSHYISLPEIIERTVELGPGELKTGWVTVSATFCTATSKSGPLPNPGLPITKICGPADYGSLGS